MKNTYIRKMIDVAHARHANFSLIPLIKLFILPSSGPKNILFLMFSFEFSQFPACIKSGILKLVFFSKKNKLLLIVIFLIFPKIWIDLFLSGFLHQGRSQFQEKNMVEVEEEERPQTQFVGGGISKRAHTPKTRLFQYCIGSVDVLGWIALSQKKLLKFTLTDKID